MYLALFSIWHSLFLFERSSILSISIVGNFCVQKIFINVILVRDSPVIYSFYIYLCLGTLAQRFSCLYVFFAVLAFCYPLNIDNFKSVKGGKNVRMRTKLSLKSENFFSFKRKTFQQKKLQWKTSIINNKFP